MKITLRIRVVVDHIVITVTNDDTIFIVSDRPASWSLTNAAVDVYDAFKMFLSLNPKLNVVFDVDHQQLHAIVHERAAQAFVAGITDAVRRAGA